jgi:hypothetical protein
MDAELEKPAFPDAQHTIGINTQFRIDHDRVVESYATPGDQTAGGTPRFGRTGRREDIDDGDASRHAVLDEFVRQLAPLMQ